MTETGKYFHDNADAVISITRDYSDKPTVAYYKILKRKRNKKFRLPRKIKKWVKRSCHFAGMQGKCPIWTNNEWSKHLIDDKFGVQSFHKPPRKIWHIKSKRHRKE